MAEKELLEYLMVRHVNVDPPRTTDPKKLPPKVYKSWKKRWVVLSTETSPAHCFINYCKEEGDWLLKSLSVVKCPLDDFKLARIQMKSYTNVLQLSFPHYCLEIAFDSFTKMDQWYNTLRPIIDRYHVDLVRCPEYPTREGEYIMECLPDSFKLWTTVVKPHTALCWEWQLKYLRRVHFHRNVSKLEVESGRNTETGEGHFFFTGWHIDRLFETMKEKMTRGARVLFADPTNSNSNSCPRLSQPSATPRTPRHVDSDSDSSTSTDSGHSSSVSGALGSVGGVFNFGPAGSTQTSRSLPASSSTSLSPPPLPPRDPIPQRDSPSAQFRRNQYQDINPSTRTVSDEYVTIRRQPGYHREPAGITEHYREPRSATDHYREPRSVTDHYKEPRSVANHYREPRSVAVSESYQHHAAVGRSGEAESFSDEDSSLVYPDTSHYNVPRARNVVHPPAPPSRNTSLCQ